jgi:hypothetical protein
VRFHLRLGHQSRKRTFDTPKSCDFEIRKLIAVASTPLADCLPRRRFRFLDTRELHLKSTWQRFRLVYQPRLEVCLVRAREHFFETGLLLAFRRAVQRPNFSPAPQT